MILTIKAGKLRYTIKTWLKKNNILHLFKQNPLWAKKEDFIQHITKDTVLKRKYSGRSTLDGEALPDAFIKIP
jgi:hypothetical protein